MQAVYCASSQVAFSCAIEPCIWDKMLLPLEQLPPDHSNPRKEVGTEGYWHWLKNLTGKRINFSVSYRSYQATKLRYVLDFNTSVILEFTKHLARTKQGVYSMLCAFNCFCKSSVDLLLHLFWLQTWSLFAKHWQRGINSMNRNRILCRVLKRKISSLACMLQHLKSVSG